jgi:serine protease Do
VAQDEESLRVHARLYQRASPAVVGIRAGNVQGSGAIVHKDGWILTSCSAVGAQNESVDVYLKGHKKISGKVVERNKDLELALVKIDPRDVAAILPLGDSDQVKVGSLCYVLGDSYGSIFTDDQVAISVGHVSGLYDLKKVNERQSSYKGPVIETNAAVNPSADGGVMLDGAGRVIGMITLNYHEAKFEGVAIPVNRLKESLERRISGGAEVWMGFDPEDKDGKILVRRIGKKGPAEKAGLKDGDVLVKIGEKDIRSLVDLQAWLKSGRPGQEVKLEVRRGNEKLNLSLILEVRDFY